MSFLNQNHSNFYCSKDNPFEHYVQQKLKQVDLQLPKSVPHSRDIDLKNYIPSTKNKSIARFFEQKNPSFASINTLEDDKLCYNYEMNSMSHDQKLAKMRMKRQETEPNIMQLPPPIIRERDLSVRWSENISFDFDLQSQQDLKKKPYFFPAVSPHSIILSKNQMKRVFKEFIQEENPHKKNEINIRNICHRIQKSVLSDVSYQDDASVNVSLKSNKKSLECIEQLDVSGDLLSKAEGRVGGGRMKSRQSTQNYLPVLNKSDISYSKFTVVSPLRTNTQRWLEQNKISENRVDLSLNRIGRKNHTKSLDQIQEFETPKQKRLVVLPQNQVQQNSYNEYSIPSVTPHLPNVNPLSNLFKQYKEVPNRITNSGRKEELNKSISSKIIYTPKRDDRHKLSTLSILHKIYSKDSLKGIDEMTLRADKAARLKGGVDEMTLRGGKVVRVNGGVDEMTLRAGKAARLKEIYSNAVVCTDELKQSDSQATQKVTNYLNEEQFIKVKTQISQKGQRSEESLEGRQISPKKKNNTIKEQQVQESMSVRFEQELIESIRYLKKLIEQDSSMKLFIRTFCFIEVEQFCFFFSTFLYYIYKISSASLESQNYQKPSLKDTSKPSSEQLGVSQIEGGRALPNEQKMVIQSIKLPISAIERIEQLLRQSFEKMSVKDIDAKLQLFQESKNLLLPDNLLDEVGGRSFIEKIFVDFLVKLIRSKEFLRDKYEEQYQAILDNINDAKNKCEYEQIICAYLKETSDDIISDIMKEKIRSLNLKLSSIDFFVLKKYLYHYLIKNENLIITKAEVLKLISRVNQLRLIICDDIVFIRKPQDLEQHMILTLKNSLMSSHFLQNIQQSTIQKLTTFIIDYITLHCSQDAFLSYIISIIKPSFISKNIDTFEYVATQAFQIYSFFTIEDRDDLKQKFDIIRYKLGLKRSFSQILPAPLPILLAELRLWVQIQITDEPLSKEILLKNLEDTELLEIIIELSHPEINAFTQNDSFAAFSFYNITKSQYQFWVKGFLHILKKRNLPASDIQIADEFLNQIFPDRYSTKKQNLKLNKISELMFKEHIKSLSCISLPSIM